MTGVLRHDLICVVIVGTVASFAALAQAGPLRSDRSAGSKAPEPALRRVVEAAGRDLSEALDRFKKGAEVQSLSDEQRSKLAGEVLETASLNRSIEINAVFAPAGKVTAGAAINSATSSDRLPSWFNRLAQVPYEERGPAAV